MFNKQKLVFLFIILFISINLSLNSRIWDVGYFQFFKYKQYEMGKLHFFAMGEFHFRSNISSLRFYLLTQQVAYQAFKNLDLEAHYCYVGARPYYYHKYGHQHRINLEVDPYFNLSKKVKYKIRNRIEFRKVQSIKNWIYVYRIRPEAIIEVKRKALNYISCANEVFYNFNDKIYFENRLIPINFNFAFGKKKTLDVFLMLLSIRTEINWRQTAALCTQINF